jgi:hypothetical protein
MRTAVLDLVSQAAVPRRPQESRERQDADQAVILINNA